MRKFYFLIFFACKCNSLNVDLYTKIFSRLYVAFSQIFWALYIVSRKRFVARNWRDKYFGARKRHIVARIHALFQWTPCIRDISSTVCASGMWVVSASSLHKHVEAQEKPTSVGDGDRYAYMYNRKCANVYVRHVRPSLHLPCALSSRHDRPP